MSVKPLEDSDMKIAGDSFDPAEPAGDDSDQTARELEHQKENGKLSRARRLGALMADDVSAVEGGNPAGDSVLQSLCGRADNASYIRMGEELYRRFIDQVKHFVDVLGFVTEEDAS